jgi:hypothetical protein
MVGAVLGAPVAHAGNTLVRAVRVPDGGIQPQAATDAGGTIHLIYFTGEPMHGDVFYVRSADGGATFSKPIRVNSQPGSVVATGTVRGAHLAVGRKGRLHVAWMGSQKAEPKAAGKASPMLYTRLNDAGDAFEPQRNVIQRRPGLDGGGSVAADGEGNVYVAWHAPKQAKDESAHHAHDPKKGHVPPHAKGGPGEAEHHAHHDPKKGYAHAGGGHAEADRHVWVARSSDDGRTFAPEVAANPKPTGVCACCGMRIFADARGRVYVLYRGATEMVNRDMHLLVSNDKVGTFEDAKVHPWKIGKCVMSTAAFSGAAGGVVAAWETREQAYFVKLSESDSDAPAESPAPGTGENRKYPAVAVGGDGRFVLAWTEGTGWNKGGVVRWQAFEKDGTPAEGETGRRDGLPAWSVPAVVAVSDGSFRIIY